ncbi:hypothetical protein BDW02DRAFT_282884 [Decorospora gaudefroyi]|uniref:Uncharacterized protein n=1 Tax=Decorospora gaudefroyi TaxID=184978 RepID=A0A6A5KIE2_9PLEO|nr:hypothetical protein BDW02DRAFT_282884 [Decorospora gaudefroyi]
MASSVPSSPIPILPSQTQTALAIAIVRSKPAGVQVRDYMLQLRAQVKRGRNPMEREDPGHYIDLVAYWKNQCQQAQDECDRLRTANIKLERSNHLLASQAGTPLRPDIEVDIQAPASKRRAASTSPVRGPKKPRSTQNKPARPPIAAAQDTIENDLDFLEILGADGTRLTEALYTTHSLCRAAETDTNTLCSSLVQIALSLGKVIRVIAQNHKQLARQGRRTPEASSLDADKSDFAIALNICARAFMSILVGISKLTESDKDTRLTSLIICELADMFKTALQSIETSARHTAADFLSQPPPPKRSKAKTAPVVVKESVPARAVAHLLISFLGFLERTDPVHQKIFDGFVFILFECIGKRLYYFTFGQNRSSSIEGNILPIPEPNDALEIKKRETGALAIRLEVKALILILERAMGLAPNHMNPQTARTSHTPNRVTRTLSVKNLTTTSRARLSPLAKDRLQRTLVACMYGGKSDDEFLDVLTKPMPSMRLGSLQNVAKVDDKEVESWYKEEIWRLVGWDILARESGW